jgi:hypothetical protein
VQQHARRRVPQRARRLAEQVAAGDGQVGVEHDGVGRHELAAFDGDPGRPAVLDADPRNGRAVADAHAVLLRDAGQRARHGVDAPAREVDPGDRVEVRDHRVQGERPVRGEPRVHGLEREDPAGARVAEEPVDPGLEPAEPARECQPQQVGGEQVAGAVEVALDEVRALQLPQAAGVCHEPQVAVGFAGAADARDLAGHAGGVGAHIEGGPVGEVRPVRGVEPGEVEPVTEVLADAAEQVFQQLRQREHGRAGVELVPVDAQPAGPSTGHVGAFEHGHVAAGGGQADGAGEPAEPGADHDHPAGGSGHGTHAGHPPHGRTGAPLKRSVPSRLRRFLHRIVRP